MSFHLFLICSSLVKQHSVLTEADHPRANRPPVWMLLVVGDGPFVQTLWLVDVFFCHTKFKKSASQKNEGLAMSFSTLYAS